MKFTSLEEYGLRCLLQMARNNTQASMTILELGEKEGISRAYIAKIMRRLRQGGLVRSTRGQKGGYQLARSPEKMTIKEILGALGGELYSDDFCGRYAGNGDLCVHTVDCSVRSLWKELNFRIGNILSGFKLADLMRTEEEMENFIPLKLKVSAEVSKPQT